MASTLECPMCSFAVPGGDSYWLTLHFEQTHTDDSPFKVTDDGSSNAVADDFGSSFDDEYVECPEPDCGENVLLEMLNDHLDLHQAEKINLDASDADSSSSHSHSKHHQDDDMSSQQSFIDQHFSTRLPEELRWRQQQQSRRRLSEGSKSAILRKFQDFKSERWGSAKKTVVQKRPPLKSARLGKRELGPYAWEEKMPSWLHKQLEQGPKVSVVNRIGADGRLVKQEVVENETLGIIPILAQLSAADNNVRIAYYCHPSTIHICKVPREGGFCGYRNTQMLVSYIQGARAQGHTEFPGRLPGILKLQDHIENAWKQGINEVCKIQTGGVKNTRKWIGTPEVQAVFAVLDIDHQVVTFSDGDGRRPAFEQLLDAVEEYFMSHKAHDNGKVRKTTAPPIYLQHPGHSLTIVGLERDHNGSGNLVVFDPIFKTAPAMHRLIGRRNIRTARPAVLDAYRRGHRQMLKHGDFETLMYAKHPDISRPGSLSNTYLWQKFDIGIAVR